MKNHTHNLLNTPTAAAHKAAHAKPGVLSSVIPTSVMSVVGGVVGVTGVALSFMVFAVAHDIDHSIARYSVVSRDAVVAMDTTVHPRGIADAGSASEQGSVLGVTTKKVTSPALTETRVLGLIDEKIQTYILNGYLKGEKGDKGENGINTIVATGTQFTTPAPISYVAPAQTNNGQSFGATILSATNLSTSKFFADNATIGVLVVGQNLSIAGLGYTWPTTQGVASTYLTNDGTGHLTWSTVAGGGGGGSGGVQSGAAGYFGYYPITGATITDQSVLSLIGSSIGIGATSTSYKLQVTGSNSDVSPENFQKAAGLSIANSSNTNGNYSILGFGNSIGDQDSAILGIHNVANGDGDLGTRSGEMRFATVEPGGDLTSRMVIKAGGQVGIGEFNPLASLTIGKAVAPLTISAANNYLNIGGTEHHSNAYQLIGFGLNATISTQSPAYMGFTTTNIGGYQNGALIFGTRSALTDTAPLERLRIDSDGNVGIGTSSPSQKLDVAGSINLPNTTGTTSGVILKNGIPFLHDFAGSGTDGQNIFLGQSAGNFTMSGVSLQGSYNTGIGALSLRSNTTGYHNAAVGYGSLMSNTTGHDNTAQGYMAMASNTTGSYSVAIGDYAMNSNIDGSANVAIGDSALYTSVSSYGNTAVGQEALEFTTTGYQNTAVGSVALLNNTTGYNNAAYGYSSLYTNRIGNENTAMGYQALEASFNGSGNTALGYQAGYGDGTQNMQSEIDSGMLFLGYQASRDASVFQSTALSRSAAIGYNARVATSSAIVLGGTGVDAVNVGIGTTVPRERFHVGTGNILLSGTDNPVRTFADSSNGGALFVAGKYLYRAGNSTFSVYDVSDASTPVLVSSTTTNVTTIYNVYVAGKYAYLTDTSANKLLIFDISNPAKIVAAGSTTTGLTSPAGLYVAGKYAYVTNNSPTLALRKLSIFDVSDPANIVALGSSNSNLNRPTVVYVQGKYAYVGNENSNNLVIFDVSDPNNLVFMSTISTGLSTVEGVYVSGKYAYVISYGNNKLSIFNVSNPSSPALIGSTTTNINQPYDVYVSGKYAYVANNGQSLSVFDVSVPSAIVPVGTVATNLLATHVKVSGKFAYVGDYQTGLEIYRLNNADTPTLVSGAVSAAQIDVSDNVTIGNDLNVQNSVTVGSGGILINGNLSVQGTGYNYFAGNVGIGTTTPTLGPLVMASGAYVTTGGAWTNSSDRNKKENFTPVDAQDILQKINTLSITRWNYKNETATTTHVGPVAQDFYAAFHTGDSDTSISTIDPAGIALLGIQGLSQRIDALQGGLNGNASSSELVVAQPVVYQNTLTVYKQVTFSEDTVGQAKIISGSTYVRVTFSERYATLPIVTVTPHEFIESNYKIASVDETGFTIMLQLGQGMDVVFDWHAFASHNSKLFVSDGTTQLVSLQVNPPAPEPESTTTPETVPVVTPEEPVASSTPGSTSTPSSDLTQTDPGTGSGN